MFVHFGAVEDGVGVSWGTCCVLLESERDSVGEYLGSDPILVGCDGVVERGFDGDGECLCGVCGEQCLIRADTEVSSLLVDGYLCDGSA